MLIRGACNVICSKDARFPTFQHYLTIGAKFECTKLPGIRILNTQVILAELEAVVTNGLGDYPRVIGAPDAAPLLEG